MQPLAGEGVQACVAVFVRRECPLRKEPVNGREHGYVIDLVLRVDRDLPVRALRHVVAVLELKQMEGELGESRGNRT